LKRRKRYFFIAGFCSIIVVAILISIYLFIRADTEDYYFQNYADALNGGFNQGQWPIQVSKEATNIYAQDQYDIHRVWMRFEIGNSDSELWLEI